MQIVVPFRREICMTLLVGTAVKILHFQLLDCFSSCLKFKGFIFLFILFFFLQEILDQIADIDLVVNFKSTEVNMVSPRREFLSMSKTSATAAGGPWKENFDIYAEQVYL